MPHRVWGENTIMHTKNTSISFTSHSNETCTCKKMLKDY